MDLKKIGRALLFPPFWLILLLAALSAAGLVAVFLNGWETAPVAYAVYVLAFYTLCVLVAFCVTVLPGRMGQIKGKFRNSRLGKRYVTDSAFRIRSSMYLSLYSSLAYAAINLLSWYTNRSWWFSILAGYYLILVLLWALLAGYVRSHPVDGELPRQWKRARSCAYILLLINLSLSGAVLMILFRNKGYHYPGILIYVMALFTFYSVIHAVIGMIKRRHLESPVLSAAQSVSLSAALVSMLNLETAMFAQFGKEMPIQEQRIFVILTGAGVSITVVTLSVVLIVRATKEIRREKNGK